MNEVKSPKKPLLYYYFVAMLLVMLFNFIAMPWISEHQIKDVDYNTFVTMTEQGEVGRVEIQEQSNRILFTSSDEKTVYKTAMVPDDGLVQRLLDAGVSTTGEENEQTSPPAQRLRCGAAVPAAHHHLCRAGTVYVAQDDGEDGRRRQLHDVQHGQVQRQGVCQVL